MCRAMPMYLLYTSMYLSMACAPHNIKKLSEIKVVIFGKIEVLILWNLVNL